MVVPRIIELIKGFKSLRQVATNPWRVVACDTGIVRSILMPFVI